MIRTLSAGVLLFGVAFMFVGATGLAFSGSLLEWPQTIAAADHDDPEWKAHCIGWASIMLVLGTAFLIHGAALWREEHWSRFSWLSLISVVATASLAQFFIQIGPYEFEQVPGVGLTLVLTLAATSWLVLARAATLRRMAYAGVFLTMFALLVNQLISTSHREAEVYEQVVGNFVEQGMRGTVDTWTCAAEGRQDPGTSGWPGQTQAREELWSALKGANTWPKRLVNRETLNVIGQPPTEPAAFMRQDDGSSTPLYPHFSLSGVGFSVDEKGLQALLFVEYHCTMCGWGGHVYLRRISGHWVALETFTSWVS